MKILVNTRLLLKDKLEGIGTFTKETLSRITRDHPDVHFIFAFDRHFDDEYIFSDNITPLVISPPARHPFLFYIWFEYSIKGLLKDLKPDLFLSPDGYLCLRSEVPQFAVMHDLNFEHYPQDIPFLARHHYRYFFPRYAKKARRIAAVSEYTKKDIMATYGISGDKIDVVYNGAPGSFSPLTSLEIQLTRKKYSGGKDYFLFVGSLHPRKNIRRLLVAFDEFRKSGKHSCKLLIAGKKYWWTKDAQDTLDQMTYREEVVFTGRLNAEELRRVMGSALALTYVPYFEGFGIPILEAMNCDVPVITSNVTSMPEVSGNAALLVDPFSVDSIKDGMTRIAADEKLRQELVEKGRERRKLFSWDNSAASLWTSMMKAIQTDNAESVLR